MISPRLLRNIAWLPVTLLVRVPLMTLLHALEETGRWAEGAQDWVGSRVPGWTRRAGK